MSLAINILKKVVDSIKKRGLKWTIEIIISKLTDYWFDIRYGTNTLGRVELDDLEIKSRNKQRGTVYEPTSTRSFKKLFNTLNFPSNSVFVDFGSGKGKVLLMASEYGFKRIVGVEFSHELCETAKRNLSSYNKKIGVDIDVEIFESDVVDYKFKDDENIFFSYNSFDEVVWNRILDNIKKSIEKNPRKIWLIYCIPIHDNIVEKHGIFLELGHYIFGGDEFNVYVSNN